jgi:hypothetical protein
MDCSDSIVLKSVKTNFSSLMEFGSETSSLKILPHKSLILAASFGKGENSIHFLKRNKVKGLFSQKGLRINLKRVLPEETSYFEGWSYLRAIFHNSNVRVLSLDFGLEDTAKPLMITTLNTSPQPLFNQLLRKNKGMKVLRVQTYNKNLERFSVLGATKHITRLGNLEELSVSLNSRNNRSQTFLSLAPSVKYLRKLKILSLNLSDRVIEAHTFNPFLVSSPIEDSIAKLLKGTPNLEQLYLGNNLELDQKALDSIGQMLPKLLKLRVLDFGCYSNNSDHESFYKGVSKSSSLKNLSLTLSPEPHKHSRIHSQLASISEIKSLEKLRIRFESEATYDTNLSGNVLGSLRSFRNLKNMDLELNFGWAVTSKQQLGGQSNPFAEGLLNSKDTLENLKVTFIKVRNEEIESLLLALPELRALRSFSLWINNSSLFSDRHFEALLSAISQMENLEKLSLKFDDCSYITNDSFVPFKKQLDHLRLKSFTLRINSCFNISNPAITNLMSLISKQDQLNELDLYFGECIGLNANILNSISHLAKLKNLEAVRLAILRNKKLNQKALTPKQEQTISGLIESFSEMKILKELWILQDFFSLTVSEQLKNNYKLNKLNFCYL